MPLPTAPPTLPHQHPQPGACVYFSCPMSVRQAADGRADQGALDEARCFSCTSEGKWSHAATVRRCNENSWNMHVNVRVTFCSHDYITNAAYAFTLCSPHKLFTWIQFTYASRSLGNGLDRETKNFWLHKTQRFCSDYTSISLATMEKSQHKPAPFLDLQ